MVFGHDWVVSDTVSIEQLICSLFCEVFLQLHCLVYPCLETILDFGFWILD